MRSRNCVTQLYSIFTILFLVSFSTDTWGYTARDIPVYVRSWLRYEQTVNDRDLNSDAFSPLDFSALPEEYDPFQQPVFEIGYLEVPAKDLFLRKDFISTNIERSHFFTRAGVEYYRFFIHPDMERLYEKEIQRYAYVRGEYLATPTSSPRSLVIWKMSNPRIYFAEKVSIYRSVGELIRINSADKLERASANSQAMSQIPDNTKEKLGFDIVPEPIVAATFGRQYGNITRDISVFPKDEDGRIEIVPGFSLYSYGHEGKEPYLLKHIRNSGKSVEDALEDFLRPLVQSYAYLTFSLGLIGEPHPQNVVFEKLINGALTGRIFFRDLDAYKADIELRTIKGRSIIPFTETLRPSKMLKLNKSPKYYDDSYQFYIRDVWSHGIENALKKSVSIPGGRTAVTKHTVASIIDRLFLAEATRHIGSQVVLHNAGDFIARNRSRLELLYPHVNWDEPNLTPEEMDDLITSNSPYDIFRNTGERRMVYRHEVAPFSVNKMISEYKIEMRKKIQPTIQSKMQKQLKKEYQRLKFNLRTSTQREIPANAIYKYYPGGIFVYSRTGRLLGYGLLEPKDEVRFGKKYYEKVNYPRKEPNRNTDKIVRHASATTSCLKYLK